MTITVTEAGLSLADPAAYTDEGRLHEALTLLRRQAPVHRVEADGYDPFWAVTRHADVMEIERNHALFINAPRPLLATAEMEARQQQSGASPCARSFTWTTRSTGWCGPSAPTGSGRGRCASLKIRIAELAKRYVDRMAELGGMCDFAAQVAVHYPAVRDPVAARAARVGLPADADADPGAVRRRGRGTAARRDAGGANGALARLLRLFPGDNRRPPGHADRRPGVGRSPTPASTASTCRTSTPPPITSSSPPPATTRPAPPSPAACTRLSSTPRNWTGCVRIRPCCRPPSTR